MPFVGQFGSTLVQFGSIFVQFDSIFVQFGSPCINGMRDLPSRLLGLGEERGLNISIGVVSYNYLQRFNYRLYL